MVQRRSMAAVVLATLLSTAGAARAFAATPPSQQRSPSYWEVSYWNNTSLSGPPAATGTDWYVDHDWGSGKPHSNVNRDRFSARWTQQTYWSAGRQRFTVTSDDGVRVTIDQNLIIDEWHDHPRMTFTRDVHLAAGYHTIKVEYYENRGDAVIQLTWGPSPANSRPWRAEYYDNLEFRGTPFRTDVAAINFDWGYGSPAPSIPGEGFSARWTRSAHFAAGTYRFRATSDDGIRVRVDGRPVVVGGWYDHPARTFYGDVTLTEGNHEIVVEYYENTGLAMVKVDWEFTPTTISGWTGEYFDNPHLSGSPLLRRSDAAVDFAWGYGSPDPNLPHDRFSARWTRMIHFDPGMYRFTASTDDGVRLWVDGHRLIDAWHDQALTSHSGTAFLEGNVELEMAYYENRGAASAKLTWEREPGGDPGQDQPVGTILVDDTDAGFVKGGPSSEWHTAREGHGGSLTWARNTNWFERYHWPGYNWARWSPDLTPGRYEVFTFVPERYTTSSEARYYVKHDGAYALRVVNQSANGNRWVSLGTYWFNGGGEERVSLSTPTYEAPYSTLLAFDAVKWVPR